jgi:hypothetical protein
MNHLEQIITDYLQSKETDYAIMINGEWGCGKTYYIRNILADKIKQIASFVPTSDTTNQKFKPYELVYVSLYGISDVNAIYDRILASLFPILQNKLVSTLKTVSSRLCKSINIDGFSNEEKKLLESFIGIPRNKVLCFDDLERISSHLDIQEVLGFLNTYTEQQKLKVFIICNENKVQEEYKDFKEKTIRFTYKFQASISEVYDNIISNQEEKYQQFLNKNKHIVLQIFDAAKYCNLRTLRFVIEVFSKIYDKTPENLECYEQVLHRLFFFTTIYSIEYKEGKSKEELDSLEKVVNYYPVDMSAFLNKSKSEPKEETRAPEYFELFAKKYDTIRSQFFYYSVIAEYIHFGFLEIDKFKEMISNIDKQIKNNGKSEESIIIDKFRNWELIEDTNFMPLIEKTLEKIEKAEFDLYAYPVLYAQLIQFEYMQIENFKITEDITKSFKDAIDKSKTNHKYSPMFNMSIPHWDSSDKTGSREKYLEIYDYAVQANEDAGIEERKQDSDKFLEMIKNNDFEKLQNYMSDSSKMYIITNIDADEIWTSLVSANGKILKTFLCGIEGFYPDNVHSWSPLNKKEKIFFETLKSKINDYNVTPKPLQYAFIMSIGNKIDRILNKYGN